MNILKQRLAYIDAMRGLAILFIVFGHIPIYCYGLEENPLPSFRFFTSMVQLPMFFFISGYVASERMLTGGVCGLTAKFRQLVIPAVLVGGVYVLLNNISIGNFVTDKFKSGYWFTLTLFECIFVQYLYEHIATKMNFRARGFAYVFGLAMLSLSLYVLSIPTVSEGFGEASGFMGVPMLRYYLYFVVGRIVRLHLTDILCWRRKECAMALLVILFVCLAIYNRCFSTDSLRGVAFHCNLVAFEMTSLLVIFAFFYRTRTYWSADQTLPKALSFLGRRTLDVYLLHYFFLPVDLHVFGMYFLSHPAPIIEALFALIVSLSVIGVSLLFGALLRSSRIVAKYALGEK